MAAPPTPPVLNLPPYTPEYLAGLLAKPAALLTVAELRDLIHAADKTPHGSDPACPIGIALAAPLPPPPG